MHNTSTPTAVRRWSFVVFLVTTPLAVATLLLWAAHMLPDTRPNLVLMVYLLFLSFALGAALTGLTAHMHLTVARAFVAGMRAQQGRAAWPTDPRAPIQLRAVADQPPNYKHSGAQN